MDIKKKNPKDILYRSITAENNSIRISPALHPLMHATKKELIALLEGRAHGIAHDPKTFYSLALSAFLEWVQCEQSGFYPASVRDTRLLQRLGSIRHALSSSTSNPEKK